MAVTPSTKALPSPGRLVIPLLNTHPFTDLCLVLVSMPALWVLGLEQFAPTAILSYSVIKLCLMRDKLIVSRPMQLLLVLIVMQMLSSVFIVEPYRVVSFARSFTTYLLALFVMLITVNTVRSWRQIFILLRCLVTAMAIAGLIGVLAILDIARPEFASLAGYLLPSWIAETDYGGLIALRSVGDVAWFSGLGNYFRVDSLFLFSTTYAVALIVTIPIALFLYSASRGAARVLHGSAILLLGTNLLFTTGRMALLAFTVGAVYWMLHARPRMFQAITLTTMLLGALLFMLATDPRTSLESVEQAAYARGQGSIISRLTIYRETLKGIAERPIFGWGTERDVIGDGNFLYPAGSHSHYLGLLYRHGIFGLAAYLLLMVSLWRQTSPLHASSSPGKTGRVHPAFLRFGRWSLLAAAVVGVTTVLDLDASVMLIAWTVFSTFDAVNRISGPPARRPRPALAHARD